MSDVIVPSEIDSAATANFSNKSVTADIYDSLEQLYNFLNDRFFRDTPLSGAAIVLQRHAHSAGHFAPNKYNLRTDASGGRTHEISMNPDDFTGKTDKQVGQTMLHEMDHEWQFLYGKKKLARFNYHDREWADKMESQGLIPSNTGMVGGKRTGARMSDFIIPGGAYDRAFDELASSGWRLNLESAIVRGQVTKPASKVKFSCPECSQNAWGKPELSIRCDVCDLRMTAPVAVTSDQSLSEAAE